MYKGPEVEKLDVVHLTLYCAPGDFIKRQILIQEFWDGAKLLNFNPVPRPCRCCGVVSCRSHFEKHRVRGTDHAWRARTKVRRGNQKGRQGSDHAGSCGPPSKWKQPSHTA